MSPKVKAGALYHNSALLPRDPRRITFQGMHILSFWERFPRPLAARSFSFAGEERSYGLYVHTPGPWFEAPTEDRLYRRLGLDLVGKTAGPEFRLARMYGMCLGILSIVVNPAEGLGEFEYADLRGIYRRCGPAMARMVIEALADAAAEPDGAGPCHCADERTESLFREFAPHARYGGDRRDG